LNETRFGPKKKSSPINLGPKNFDTFWCTGWAWNCQIIFRCASIHGRAGFILICEHERALYGIKCVLRIFLQTSFTWLNIVTNKKKSTLCKHWFRVTHSTNEDLLNIKRKGDPEVSYPLSYVRYHWNPEPVCNKSHFVSLFYLYWYFLIY
jgi:hypothetical protein